MEHIQEVVPLLCQLLEDNVFLVGDLLKGRGWGY